MQGEKKTLIYLIHKIERERSWVNVSFLLVLLCWLIKILNIAKVNTQ